MFLLDFWDLNFIEGFMQVMTAFEYSYKCLHIIWESKRTEIHVHKKVIYSFRIVKCFISWKFCFYTHIKLRKFHTKFLHNDCLFYINTTLIFPLECVIFLWPSICLLLKHSTFFMRKLKIFDYFFFLVWMKLLRKIVSFFNGPV